MELKQLGWVGLLIGILLFPGGVGNALKDFESQMNIVDWLIMVVAPSLPPDQGAFVLALTIGLLLLVTTTLFVSIEKLENPFTW